MTVVRTGKARPFARSTPSGAFDQYLLDIQKLPMISDPDEEKRLARSALAGDERAAERLVTANLRFVISYAVWWVRQAVLKALAEQTRSVRIPLNQNSALVRMSRAKSFLAQELGREPTDAEIAIALNDTVDNIRSAHRMTSTEVSLDAPVERQDRGASTFGERVAGPGGSEIEEMTDVRLQREFIDRIFERHLTPRERKILSLYYGLDEGSEALTLEKIGALLGVTRERIRQIRERAFEKLRDSPDVRSLRGFWGAA